MRPLARADLARLSGWLAEPHVARWWRDPNDLAAVTATYQPCIDGTDPTEVFVIEAEGRPAGFIQRYLTADDPDWDRAVQATGAVTGCSAGIDYLIGEPGLCGHGYGTAAIALFTALTFRRYPQARAVVAAPQQDNVASWRALERAGFSRWWSGRLDSTDPGDADAAYLYGTAAAPRAVCAARASPARPRASSGRTAPHSGARTGSRAPTPSRPAPHRRPSVPQASRAGTGVAWRLPAFDA